MRSRCECISLVELQLKNVSILLLQQGLEGKGQEQVGTHSVTGWVRGTRGHFPLLLSDELFKYSQLSLVEVN